MLTIVLLAIVIALLFDFLNGMNDAANSIATIVATTCVFSHDGCLLGSILELCRYLYFWSERGSHDGRRNRGSLENQ